MVDLARLTEDVEAISRMYAQRFGIDRDETWFLLKLQEEIGELTQVYLMRTGKARAKGLTPAELDDRFGAELADVVCHALLMAHHHGVDLKWQITQKWLSYLPASESAPPATDRSS